jgi:ribose transport system substrate-binding protein
LEEEMKKIVLTALAVLVGATLFIGCNGNTETSAATSEEPAKLVYLITMDKMDQHWVSVDKGARTMANALGLKYKWDAPDVKDNAKQIEAVNNAVADKADLILLAANDPNAISSAVKNAKDKGVMIIYVDSPANEPAIATLSTNNTQAGVLAGETMVAELKARSISSGKIGIIGVNTATNSTMSRENGFKSVVEEAGFTILVTEYKDGDAAASQEAATGFITGNADLVGLYGTNEGSTVGVGNAIKASDKKIVGIGFDKSDAIQNLLDDDILQDAMAQNPYTMGFLGVAQAYAALTGGSTGPAVIDTGVAILK